MGIGHDLRDFHIGKAICKRCGVSHSGHYVGPERGGLPTWSCPTDGKLVDESAFEKSPFAGILPKPVARPDESAGHPEFLKILDEMRELHCKKAADYGRGADPFANVRAGAEFGVDAWIGVMIRANDKIHRIKSYIANGSLKNESLEDSLKDLAAYCLIALVLFREQEAAKKA